MKSCITRVLVLAIMLLPAFLFAQQNSGAQKKFALVIGNGAYKDLTKLNNPVNDADDVAAALQNIGFTVEKLLNSSQEQIDSAVIRLKNRLSAEEDSYGFFFYAGHGVQSGGDNYLIPVDANIPSENAMRSRAVSVQMVLDELNDARNSLNVVVLDACRDNPFSWSRSGTRGLAVVSRQPADSIIVYATSAGQRASDGDGRNGLFTSRLMNNLTTPGLEVMDVFRRTGMEVASASKNQQIPAIYSQVFKQVYLGAPAATSAPAAETAAIQTGFTPQAVPQPLPPKPEKVKPDRESTKETRLWSVGASVGTSFADPYLIGTVRGTIAPFNYQFFEFGVDLGFISGISEVKSSWAICPYAHYAFFWPFNRVVAAYAGAGAGYYRASYRLNDIDDPVIKGFFAADAIAGVNILSMIDVSYTLRTNFKRLTNKLSVGYAYRFK